MHQFVHAHEIHVHAAQQRRFREAIEAEQRKLARLGSRPARLDAVRAAIGAMLIAFGERIARETARPATTRTLNRRVAGTA